MASSSQIRLHTFYSYYYDPLLHGTKNSSVKKNKTAKKAVPPPSRPRTTNKTNRITTTTTATATTHTSTTTTSSTSNTGARVGTGSKPGSHPTSAEKSKSSDMTETTQNKLHITSMVLLSFFENFTSYIKQKKTDEPISNTTTCNWRQIHNYHHYIQVFCSLYLSLKKRKTKHTFVFIKLFTCVNSVNYDRYQRTGLAHTETAVDRAIRWATDFWGSVTRKASKPILRESVFYSIYYLCGTLPC